MGVAEDIYEGGGAKPFSFENVGQIVEGEILALRKRQLPKFGTETPETWDDGSPKFTPIVTIQTSLSEDDEDDGKRDIYLRSNAFTAFGKALREAFRSKPGDDEVVGSTLKMQFHATEKTGKGQPRKLFRAKIVKKSTAGDAWDSEKTEKPANGAAPKPASRPPEPDREPDPPPVDW